MKIENRILANAIATNAKFKVGDKVKGRFGGDVMTVVKVGSGSGPDLMYTLKNKDGQTVGIEERNLVIANAIATNASFSKGDVVTKVCMRWQR